MRKLLLIMILCNALQYLQAQDVHFSQFYETPLLRNPALAGIFSGDFRIQGVYRDQWNNITNAYRTGSLNGEYKMPIGSANDFLTVSLQTLFDKAGSAGLTQTHFLPGFNYHKSLSDQQTLYLSLGMNGGLVYKGVDLTRITTDEQWGGGAYDPSLPTGEFNLYPNFNQWDASVGLSLNGAWGDDERHSFFVGAAYHHLNRPKNSFYKNASIELEPKYVISAGTKLNLNETNNFIIQADYSTQGSFNQFLIGATYEVILDQYTFDPQYKIAGGLYYRSEDALIPVIKVEKKPVAISLSYDINISLMRTTSQGTGGFELSVVYTGITNNWRRDVRNMVCPKF